MATKYWVGGSVGNLTNWATAANWSPSGVPVADDTVIFDGRSSYNCTDGMAQGGVSLDLLQVKSNYRGTIGSSATPLSINPDEVFFEGTGSLHLKCAAANATTDSDIDRVFVNSKGGTITLYSNVNSASYAAEFTELCVQLGEVTLAEGCDVRTIRMAGGTLTIGEECKRVKATADLIDLYVYNGAVSCDSPLGTLEVYGGRVTIGSTSATPTARPDIDLLRLWGGLLNWQPVMSGDTPQLKQFYAYGGVLAALGNNAKQIGTGSEKQQLWPSAKVDLSGSGGVVTLYSGTKIINYGGTLKLPIGTQQTW